MPLSYAGGIDETVEHLRDFEAVGLDLVLLPEAYTFDSVSQLGYIAAKTRTVKLATSILNVYSRTPTLLAMTAAGVDYVSGGRFVLGIGSSGVQVVEGFHGVRFDSPLGRTREVVDICRQVWSGERLQHAGRHYEIPLTEARGGSGLGKPLKLINRQQRSRIPIVLAALGPKNVSLAAEICEGWEPIFYLPEKAAEVFGASLDEGIARRAPELPALDIMVDTHLMISEDSAEIDVAVRGVREHLALYIGGMGAKGKNYYFNLAARYGFEEAAEKIQDLYLDGDKAAAADAVPEALVHGVALIGPLGHVRERVAAFAEAGVTTLNVRPLANAHQAQVRDIGLLKEQATV